MEARAAGCSWPCSRSSPSWRWRQAAPALAATTYVGGPAAGDYPLYVPDDYTTCALRFTATGLLGLDGQPLTAPTDFHVKIRLSPIPGPNGSNNRGFTWNDQTKQWVQERADWSSFPTITTDAVGNIATSNRWFFFQFGDTTKSGTYYLMVSLQQVGAPIDSGATQNGQTMPAVTLLDMSGGIAGATPGFWVHNGVAVPSNQAAKRVEADAAGTLDVVWALSRTEANGVDDDASGADDEDYGPAGAAGDFRLGVPASMAFDVKLQNAIWPALASSFTGPLADVDVALGAPDTTPPSAPVALNVQAGNVENVLTWGAANDNTAVTGYRVYKWTDPASGSGYTGRPTLVATTASDVTTFTDPGLTNGVAYHYIVRAVDAATNIGPRAAATATPKMPTRSPWCSRHRSSPGTRRSPSTATWWTGTPRPSDRPCSCSAATTAQAAGRRSPTWRRTWLPIHTCSPGRRSPTRATFYRLSFAGTDVYASSVSSAHKVTPQVKLGTPAAPKTVKTVCFLRTLRLAHAQADGRPQGREDQVLPQDLKRQVGTEEDRGRQEHQLQDVHALQGDAVFAQRG